MEEVRAVAIGAEDRILVAGDKADRKSSPPTARSSSEIALEEEPNCLAVGNAEHAFPGRLYVGMRDHVEVYDGRGPSRRPFGAGRASAPC